MHELTAYFAEYSRLIEHWRVVLPGDALLDVEYEALVRDQEAWSRRMVEFIGLPWDPGCLQFYRGGRTVNTHSKWQARQKNQRLVGRAAGAITRNFWARSGLWSMGASARPPSKLAERRLELDAPKRDYSGCARAAGGRRRR